MSRICLTALSLYYVQLYLGTRTLRAPKSSGWRCFKFHVSTQSFDGFETLLTRSARFSFHRHLCKRPPPFRACYLFHFHIPRLAPNHIASRFGSLRHS
ncbi:hypothetical protein JB92DRAFT_2962663 [Gautieria morchelliformis]|nr:hypothetical protein JB92DRAFT_2962663 [Gautieria morchelliformis]